MKNIIIIFILSLSLGLPALANQKSSHLQYSSIIDDLPLMSGMIENTEESIVFDKPDGRIVEFTTSVWASKYSINKFYKKNLPPLGWKILSQYRFLRDNEILTIDIKEKENDNFKNIKFTLKPKN